MIILRSGGVIMKNPLKKIRKFLGKLLLRLRLYFRKLLFPIYLFPLKIATYSLYYLLLFLIKLILALLGLLFDALKYPFKSMKHFLKFALLLSASLYLVASLFVIGDYLTKQYGWWGKFFCAYGTKEKLLGSVVRVVGGYSEGSGFFISETSVLTNFHVIADEPSPKIIFPDGSFTTPVKILGDKNADLALLFTDKKYPEKVLTIPDKVKLYADEPLTAAGYPLGTELTGKATTVKGNFIDFRHSKIDPVYYIQTNVSLVPGMSGGPLTDQCGTVVGVNTTSLAGMSLFIGADQARDMVPTLTDQGVTKIEVDPSSSPEGSVKAFYTYLKARRMEDGFKLLSREYLKKTNFQEWTNRFKDILDVDVIKSEKFEKSSDTAFVKFSTKNWVDNEAEFHFYEGTWQTLREDGVFKMLKSNIKEVENPDYSWLYE
ncbi:MAG: trypsin-like peptidase domain-containing protein [bacterium]|nr:trypsin-like peptidase domain-containing protein [bacterium]